MLEPDENLQMRCIAKLRALLAKAPKTTGKDLDALAAEIGVKRYDHSEPAPAIPEQR